MSKQEDKIDFDFSPPTENETVDFDFSPPEETPTERATTWKGTGMARRKVYADTGEDVAPKGDMLSTVGKVGSVIARGALGGALGVGQGVARAGAHAIDAAGRAFGRNPNTLSKVAQGNIADSFIASFSPEAGEAIKEQDREFPVTKALATGLGSAAASAPLTGAAIKAGSIGARILAGTGVGAVEGLGSAAAQNENLAYGTALGAGLGFAGTAAGQGIRRLSTTGRAEAREAAAQSLGNRARKLTAGSGFENLVDDIATQGNIFEVGDRAVQRATEAAKQTLKNSAQLRQQAGALRKEAIAAADGFLPPTKIQPTVDNLRSKLLDLSAELNNQPNQNREALRLIDEVYDTVSNKMLKVQADGKGTADLLNNLFDLKSKASSGQGSAKLVGGSLAETLDEIDDIIGANIPQVRDQLGHAKSLFNQSYQIDDVVSGYTTQPGISSIRPDARDVSPLTIKSQVQSGADLGRLSDLSSVNIPESASLSRSAQDLGENATRLRDIQDLRTYSKQAYGGSMEGATADAAADSVPGFRRRLMAQNAVSALRGPASPYEALAEQAARSAEAGRLRNVLAAKYGDGPVKGIERILSSGVPLTLELVQRIGRSFGIQDPAAFEQDLIELGLFNP